MTLDLVPPLTVAEVAALAGVSVSLVRKVIAAGVLDARRCGRALRIPASAARRFAADLGAEPAEDAHQAHQTHGAHQAHAVKLKLAQR